MKIEKHRNFSKNYSRRIVPFLNLDKKFKSRLELFSTNPKNPILKDHALTGSKKNFRAFSITGDIRVVYRIKNGVIQLYDIGSHNQVY